MKAASFAFGALRVCALAIEGVHRTPCLLFVLVAVAVSLAASLVAMPPPLCRGKQYANYDRRLDASPSARALAEVQTAYDMLCPKKNCGDGTLYQNPSVGMNALTWVSGLRDGEATRAKIVYSSGFLDQLAVQFGPGASFGVLAHEVGHHLTAALSMRSSFDSSWDEELRADYLAGCALGRAGRPSAELEAALRALAAVASRTHPASNLRNSVVKKGYDTCRAELADKHGPGFGIGAQLKAHAKEEGCWSYRYRDKNEIAKVGPIAAKRRRSDKFNDRAACLADRAQRPETEAKTAEDCSCE